MSTTSSSSSSSCALIGKTGSSVRCANQESNKVREESFSLLKLFNLLRRAKLSDGTFLTDGGLGLSGDAPPRLRDLMRQAHEQGFLRTALFIKPNAGADYFRVPSKKKRKATTQEVIAHSAKRRRYLQSELRKLDVLDAAEGLAQLGEVASKY